MTFQRFETFVLPEGIRKLHGTYQTGQTGQVQFVPHQKEMEKEYKNRYKLRQQH